jgi:Xaa-Pro aminopeptidase
MSGDLLKEKVICSISTGELERRWKAARTIMKQKKIDFLLIQNSNDYLGGYIKWFTDLPAVHAYPNAAIFPVDDGMTLFTHGSSDPKQAGPPAWLVRGVKKRISTPIMLSLNYTCSFDAERVVEELQGYKNIKVSFVNEGATATGFSRYIREHLTGATFVDITDEIDEIKAIKSPEEIERIKYSAYVHDEAMKACFAAIKPGVREFEIAAMGRLKCRMLGSEQQFILIGSAPPGQAFPYSSIHAMNRQLKEGDQIGILIEAVDPAGYYTHLHRISCIGKIPEDLQKQFEEEKELQALNLKMLKPGAAPMEMWDATNDFLRSRGYAEESRLYAHGQGYDLVERPSFQIGEKMKIKAGMNIAVHPVVASPKAIAILCDNYMVTETGVSECLHKTPKEIFVVS